MLTTKEDPTAPLAYDPRELISDLFHQLSQPVTSLCCSLELALLQTLTVEQYGEVVSRTLNEAQKVSWLVTAIRELFDASEVPEGCEVLELRHAIEQTLEDLRPVAESAGVQVHYLPLSACPVGFDATRLRQGLFHLLGFMLGSGGRGAVLKIDLDQHAGQPALSLTVAGPPQVDSAASTGSDQEHLPQELVRRLGLGIARAIFKAAGANFSVEHRAEAVSVEVHFGPRAAA